MKNRRWTNEEERRFLKMLVKHGANKIYLHRWHFRSFYLDYNECIGRECAISSNALYLKYRRMFGHVRTAPKYMSLNRRNHRGATVYSDMMTGRIV